ncbi:MAG: choice-of-anchor D domain-containing protein [Candidatus Latescibacterota bacterium]|nr:choice-of-anchor D domain-containing protein [Candidatus Latescibacterota bacterium]
MQLRMNRWGLLLFPAIACNSPAVAQSVKVNPAVVNLGAVKPGTTGSGKLRLDNLGSDELLVLVRIDGAGFTASADSLKLPGGQSRSLIVEFAAADVGLFNATLGLQVKKLFGAESYEVEIEASVSSPVFTSRPNPALGLEIEATTVGTTSRQTLQLGNAGRVPLDIDSLSIVPASPSMRIEGAVPASLAPGEEVGVSVAFTPARDGLSLAHIVMHTADLPENPQIPVRGDGLAPWLAVSPLPEVGVDFESLEVGTQIQRALSVLNRGRSELVLSQLEVEGNVFSSNFGDSIVTVPPSGRKDVALYFEPRYEGLAKGLVRLYSNDPTHPVLELPIAGTAQINPPHIEVLNRSVISFGSVPIGKPAREQVILWNRGGTTYAVEMELDHASTGEFELETNSVLLQPGESAKVEILFHPKEIGERSQQLFLETPGGRTTYRLVGTGKYLKLSPSTVDFDRVPVGESNAVVVELVNIGNADFTISQINSSSDAFTVYTPISPDSKFLLPANSLRSLPVNVTFSPASRGLATGTLGIEGFWQEGTETLEVLLNGTGVAAEIELHPSGALDFGYVVLGQSDTRTLVATNTGDTPLRVRANALSREVSVEPNVFALQPGQSTTLNARFSPETLGDRFGQVLLVSNDVRDKAQPIKVRGKGVLESIDLAQIAAVAGSRKSSTDRLGIRWNNTPFVVLDGTKIDLSFQVPDSLRQALVGRRIDVEWIELDDNYDPKGSPKQIQVQIYADAEGQVQAEDLNLRLREEGAKRVRLRITTRSYPDSPPHSVSQVIEAGGWKWEFEAKPLVSFLTIRPGRDYMDGNDNRVKGKTERLIGLPGIAFAGYHNAESPSISGVHLTAIGNILEALSTDNAIAVSLGLAVSLYKNRFLFGFGWDIYDSRAGTKRRGTQDYIMTFKYSGLF